MKVRKPENRLRIVLAKVSSPFPGCNFPLFSKRLTVLGSWDLTFCAERFLVFKGLCSSSWRGCTSRSKRNNSPRERTSPKEVNSTTNHLFSISFSIEGGKGYVIIGKTKENNPRAICSLVFPIASYTFGNFSFSFSFGELPGVLERTKPKNNQMEQQQFSFIFFFLSLEYRKQRKRRG